MPAESFYLGRGRDRHSLLNLEGFETGYADFDDLQELNRGCETSPIYYRPIVLASLQASRLSTNMFLDWSEPYPAHCDIGDYTFPKFSSIIRYYEGI